MVSAWLDLNPHPLKTEGAAPGRLRMMKSGRCCGLGGDSSKHPPSEFEGGAPGNCFVRRMVGVTEDDEGEYLRSSLCCRCWPGQAGAHPSAGLGQRGAASVHELASEKAWAFAAQQAAPVQEM